MHMTKISVAAVLAAIALSTPAVSQSVDGTVSGGASGNGAVSVPGTTAQGSGGVNVDGGVSASGDGVTVEGGADANANAAASASTQAGAGAGAGGTVAGLVDAEGNALTLEGECGTSDGALDLSGSAMASGAQVAAASDVTVVTVNDCALSGDLAIDGAVEANSDISAALEAQGVGDANILAVESTGEGAVRVYVSGS